MGKGLWDAVEVYQLSVPRAQSGRSGSQWDGTILISRIPFVCTYLDFFFLSLFFAYILFAYLLCRYVVTAHSLT